jgi:hypothetical protein
MKKRAFKKIGPWEKSKPYKRELDRKEGPIIKKGKNVKEDKIEKKVQ